jgi:HAMP domain-containing protein
MLQLIRSSIGLKVTLILAAVTLVLTAVVAWVIIARQTNALQEATLTKARLAAKLGARSYGRALEDGIDNGYFTVNEAFDTNYAEIKGYDWGGEPKYHTKYDFYTDRVILPFQDQFLTSKDIVSAVGADVNGYVPTHNTEFTKPLTGDAAKDLAGNRTKRIYKDPVALKASQNEEEILVQEYRRDTGSMLWDVSAPIYVKGKHWGGFRVLVSVDQVMAERTALFWQLAIMFLVFALVSSGVIYFMVQNSMRPLVGLTERADELSTGEALDATIQARTPDEVGRMAKSLDRLRKSLKAAMERLGE